MPLPGDTTAGTATGVVWSCALIAATFEGAAMICTGSAAMVGSATIIGSVLTAGTIFAIGSALSTTGGSVFVTTGEITLLTTGEFVCMLFGSGVPAAFTDLLLISAIRSFIVDMV